ncbi:MAG: hypothetical protein AAFZ92_02260 [Pseudomonadota bacterium]
MTVCTPISDDELLNDFCRSQCLPAYYQAMAQRYFMPLAQALAQQSSQARKPLFIGINGCQGSGKSTLATLLTTVLAGQYHKKVAKLSIDDFYLTKAERQQLAKDIHPLFLTRGVPGTHDMRLLNKTLDSLASTDTTAIPRFNKAIDDRAASDHWDSMAAAADIIILEGWCVGVTPQTEETLFVPVNDLESNEDAEGLWRNTINTAISQDYLPLFTKIDKLIMLKAPSFDCVYHWRKKQEDKLRAKTDSANSTTLMDDAALTRFIQHYQRLSEHLLSTLAHTADLVFELNIQHQIVSQYGNID